MQHSLKSFRSRIGSLYASAIRAIVIELPRFIWLDWDDSGKLAHPLAHLIEALQREAVIHTACGFRVKFSFECPGSYRYLGITHGVVHGELLLRSLDWSWQRVFGMVREEIERAKMLRKDQSALQFLLMELTPCRETVAQREL